MLLYQFHCISLVSAYFHPCIGFFVFCFKNFSGHFLAKEKAVFCLWSYYSITGKQICLVRLELYVIVACDDALWQWFFCPWKITVKTWFFLKDYGVKEEELQAILNYLLTIHEVIFKRLLFWVLLQLCVFQYCFLDVAL